MYTPFGVKPDIQKDWGYLHSWDTMIYSINDRTYAYPTGGPEYAQYDAWDRGPTFGSGYDVTINADLKFGTCNLNNAYKGPAADTTRTCGEADFKIDELEVWYMKSVGVMQSGDTSFVATDQEMLRVVQRRAGNTAQDVEEVLCEVGRVVFVGGLDLDE